MFKNKTLLKTTVTLLVLLSMITVMVVPASATEIQSGYIEFETVQNPLYENTGITFTVRSTRQGISPVSSEAHFVDTDEEAAKVLRAGMADWESSIQVNIKMDDLQSLQTHFRNIFLLALEHTGNPTEGDYLKWHYAGYGGGASYYTDGSVYYVTLTYQVSYYTTAAQETALDAAIDSLICSMDSSLKTDNEKLAYIYDYLCENVSYDYDNLNDLSYNLKFSAYAALINGTAVCQGYSTLLYRLALELGIDCRVIPGTGNGGDHSWNIVKLNNKFYNLDATWDSILSQKGKEYSFYLRCNDNFEEHFRNVDYDTTAFNAKYPMADGDYKAVASIYTNGVLSATYSDINEAISCAAEDQVIVLDDDAVINASLANNVFIDLAGFDLTGTLNTNGYEVFGIDNTTNKYVCDSVGFFNCVDSNGNVVEPARHFKSSVTGSTKRYLSIETKEGYSFHRIYLSITHMNLRPGVTGVGYKALFCADDMVQSELLETNAYGFNLWLGDNGKRVSAGKGKDSFVSRGLISMRLVNFDVAQYGEERVNASVFITLEDGTIIESSEFGYTLRSLLEQINENADTFNSAQISALKDMCEKYLAYISSWEIGNILSA